MLDASSALIVAFRITAKTHWNDKPLSNNSRICANGVREESNLGEPRIANRMLLHSALIDPMPAISFGIRVPAFILCSHKQWLCSMAKVTLVISNPTAG